MVRTINVDAITKNRVKTLGRISKKYTILIFPLAWSRTIEWLKPKNKVVLTLSGDSITIVPCLSPTPEKETEQKVKEVEKYG